MTVIFKLNFCLIEFGTTLVRLLRNFLGFILRCFLWNRWPLRLIRLLYLGTCRWYGRFLWFVGYGIVLLAHF